MTELPAAATARSNSLWILPLLCISLTLAACGITAPRRSEGFADLESLHAFDVKRTMTLSFGPAVLHFAASHIDDDPETARLLRSLDGVRIRIYEIKGHPDRVAEGIRSMTAHLQGEGWEPVLLVHEQDEETHMLLKSRDGLIRGLTVLTSDGEAEAVVINLMGAIEPARFSDVMLALEVDAAKVPEPRLAN